MILKRKLCISTKIAIYFQLLETEDVLFNLPR